MPTWVAVLMGIAFGAFLMVLGVVLSRNLFTADETVDATSFTVPWELIGTISVATVVVALLMTWMPSRMDSIGWRCL